MKCLRLYLRAILAGCACLLLVTRAQADDDDPDYGFWQPYDLGTSSLAIASPYGTNTLNCLVPANDGSYVAIWDDGDGAYVERRDPAGTRLWMWRPPEPRPDSMEVTRAVLASKSHVLWCSAQRWFYLSLTNGAVSRNSEWSLPYVDVTRFIPQNDLLYVLYGSNASVYDTNMERQATVALNWPAGYWRAHGGTWMLDLSTRTNRTLRVAQISAGLVVQGTYEFTLPNTRSDGYTEHRVVGANADAMFVVSSLNWPDQTSFYFSRINSAGTMTFQHRMNANQIITGVAVLPDGGGWLVGAQYVGEASSRQTLYRVDKYGRPCWQLLVGNNPADQWVVLNAVPPRVLRLSDGVPVELRSVRTRSWFDVLDRLVAPAISWDNGVTDISPIVGGTNHYWMEPIRLNNG